MGFISCTVHYHKWPPFTATGWDNN